MKKESTYSTYDDWTYEVEDVSPLASAKLTVAGNGTKTSQCLLYFLPFIEGTTPLDRPVEMHEIHQLNELINQLTIISAQWDDRLGNSKRR